MSATVIDVEHLYKEYKLGVIGHGTLYRDLQSWWAKIRGKEDPNSLISSHHGEKAEKDSFLALNDVSFKIKQGDRVGIIGKNGAGKSTLLKILSRITSPTKGMVKIHGKVGSLLEVGTGFHPELTGKENIFLNGSILGMNRHEISRKLDEIVYFAGIEKHINTPVKRYSSGMMVRLGFTVAAHLDTDILIADEVLAVGDFEFQEKALGKMGDLSTGEGRTILFVSHNLAMIARLCEKVLLIQAGRLVLYGQASETIAQYINSSDKATPAAFKPQDGEYIGDEYAQLLSATIEDHQGRATNEVQITSPCVFSMSFNVHKTNGRRLTPVFHVYREDGSPAFSAFYPTAQFAIGAHCVCCHIPANMLNDGGYSVSVALLSFEPFSICHFQVEAALACTVVDTLDNVPTRGGYPRAIQGAMRPLFQWVHKESG
jgi:lipopolysaccharide transport system ATP-binding protein